MPFVILWLWLVLAPVPPLLDGIRFSPRVLDRNGELLRLGLTPDEKYRVRTHLAEVPPDMLKATLLYEDRYFHQHPGVNPLAVLRSALSMLGGGRRMGGSTLTMQVARLRYNLITSSLPGKLEQMFRALQLEYHYSKQDILEAYCNLAPYGGNVEGIGAAALVYFQHPVAQLTTMESLALATVPQNPGKRTPLGGQDFAAARVRMHTLWAEQHNLTPPKTLPALRIRKPSALPFIAPHVATEMLTRQSDEPIRTTIDKALQRLLEERLTKFTTRGRIYALNNAAAMLVHWPSMEIRALAGSADFNNTAISGQVDGSRARRSPGSTLKPFIYALALDQGLIHPQTLLIDSPRSFSGYDPENFDRIFRGPLPAQEALRTSRNIPAIWLATRLKPDLYSFLNRAGVELPESATHYGLSIVLGGAEVTMRQLADLYAMLPNKGVWQRARLERTTTDEAQALLSPEAALVTLRMLEHPNHNLRTPQGKLPLLYKTGTSNRFRDAWTAGIAGPYVLVVWVGNFDNTPNPLLVGTEVAAPLFTDIIQSIALREPLPHLIPQQQEDLNIIRIPVCTATGDTDISLCPDTTETWYIPGRSPTQSSGVFRTILLDTATGLRACRPSPTTQERIWEFWPSDLQEIFAQAGIVKPAPPPFLPECLPESETTVAGSAPRILVPKEGVAYQRRIGDQRDLSAIPLTASVDADARALFWFAGERFLGRVAPGTPLLWQPDSGVHMLRVVDDLGRSSTRRVLVQAVP